MKKESPLIRVWRHIERGDDDECWEWKGYRVPSGYGIIKDSRNRNGVDGAHRIAWEATFGPIPEGLWVLHKCDNPPCCNPNHLFLGNATVNNLDKLTKGRAKAPKGSKHLHAKLDDDKAIAAMARCLTGRETHKEIGQALGVSRAAINDLWWGKTWSHLFA